MLKVKVKDKLAKIEEQQARWVTRSIRAANVLQKLSKQRKRILAQIAAEKAKPKVVKPKVSDVTEVTELAYALPDDRKLTRAFSEAMTPRRLTGKTRHR